MTLRLAFLAVALMATSRATSAEPAGPTRAIEAVLAAHPELAERLAGSLPPTTIETARGSADEWRVAILTWGSGRPGILAADCFVVSDKGEVRRAGEFRNRDLAAEIRRIDPASCTALAR